MYITLPQLQAIHFHFCCGFVVILLFFSFPRTTTSFIFISRTHLKAFLHDLFNHLKAQSPHTPKKKKNSRTSYFCFL
ncbi:hypothetical protein K450DRAFT_243499 [Umbelopsis ramanniana AG]|uniref:Uncharacterized protein n=1 Tax=Umbelopsis ramanniana AG TaxID=1314678 RepID=A0AAD5E8U0_UMBRA|nr:uncharacterized protein K450DRAFT_243499 [Umbelopsis ramanniana AG]KAI8579248.1 hypothetical protein K450DRAFT_243499 [Umbelopsis ramanniana AG]